MNRRLSILAYALAGCVSLREHATDVGAERPDSTTADRVEAGGREFDSSTGADGTPGDAGTDVIATDPIESRDTRAGDGGVALDAPAADRPAGDAPPADAVDDLADAGVPSDEGGVDVAGEVGLADASTPVDVVCVSGQTQCGAACVDLQVDLASCGACGQACAYPNATTECAAGRCSLVACRAGTANCDREDRNGCEDLQTDVANCGSCGVVCSVSGGTPACSGGACTVACAAGFGDCDGNRANGCESPLGTALGHCGGCGRRCVPRAGAAAVCSAGACALRCDADRADCDGDPSNGCEVDTTSHPAHCGGCGRGCAGSTVCRAGACAADCGTLTRCDRACVDLQRDRANCGSCGNVCPAYCVAGGCAAVTRVSAGSDLVTCAVLSDGSAWCWGHNNTGQVGDGTTVDRYRPVRVPGVAGVRDVVTSGQNGCALGADGLANCWGHNGEGQIGDGTTEYPRLLPTRVRDLTGLVELEHGGTWGIARGAAVWCWGRGLNGQLPIGDSTSHPTPIAARLPTNVAQLAIESGHGCARLATGAVECWGDNSRGQLGDGTQVSRTMPAIVPGIVGAQSIAVGSERSVALLADGAVWTWGGDSFGSLGDPTLPTEMRYRVEPARVAGVDAAVGLTADVHVTCAWNPEGLVRCWGIDNYGQLGDGQMVLAGPVPVIVQGLPPVTDVDAGQQHVCAIDRSGALWCWGQNRYGNLGDGTTTTRLVPIRLEF